MRRAEVCSHQHRRAACGLLWGRIFVNLFVQGNSFQLVGDRFFSVFSDLVSRKLTICSVFIVNMPKFVSFPLLIFDTFDEFLEVSGQLKLSYLRLNMMDTRSLKCELLRDCYQSLYPTF